ncbi:rhomboid family intramembrane serine protease [Rhodanobacter sp. L36]|uniref:rhomboid family intramembrane serine protease n=1 Tax=Rhodanobacter sp. L36 TaxID=1747221 RepID=UPI00131D1B98|nr:rhomboid family intramembrane serine protease [Rhodanobacter sp. L36]
MPFDLPPVTRNLLIANVVVFLLQMMLHDLTSLALTQHFALWPLGPDVTDASPDGNMITGGFRIWQLVTYAFMHESFLHIASNMFGLLMFGGIIERTLGARNFLVYYFTCAVTAALVQLIVVKFFIPGFYPTLGASGAIFGILLALGMLYPHEKLMVIPIPVPMPAWVLVTGYAVIELVTGVTGTLSGIAHFAHLGGMLGGIVLIQYWRGRLPIKPKRVFLR